MGRCPKVGASAPLLASALALGAWTSSVWASNLPSAQATLAELMVLPVMVAMTAIGGAYPLLRGRSYSGKPWLLPALACSAILVSLVSEELAIIVTLVFGGLALMRSASMLRRGFATLAAQRKSSAIPAQVGVSASRLLVAGGLLALATLTIGGTGLALYGHSSKEPVVAAIVGQLVVAQLFRTIPSAANADAAAVAPAAPGAPGAAGAAADAARQRNLLLDARRRLEHRGYAVELEPGRARGDFQLRAWPQQVPIFPYNLLASLPSYHADQTGQVRMIRVHRAGQRCPANAPVGFNALAPSAANAL